MKKKSVKGALFIVIAASLWAFDGVVRRSLYSLSPIIIVFFEHLAGSIILVPFFLANFRKEKVSGKDLTVILLISLFSGLLGTLWFTKALLMVHYISFSVVFLLQKLQPIFAILMAKLILKEKLSRKYWQYVILALIAAYFVTFPKGFPNFETGGKTITAGFYALGAAFVWGSSTAFSRFVLLKNRETIVTSLRFFMTTVLAAVWILVIGFKLKDFFITPSQIGRFIFIALSTGMIALLIYYKGLKQTQVKVATILELTFPLLAIFIDMVVYKTFLSPVQIGAGAVLLFIMSKITLVYSEK